MGIYDRDYARREPNQFFGFANGWTATKLIVAINVVVFLVGWLGGINTQRLLGEYLAIHSDQFLGLGFYQALTAAFLHFDLMHLLFNMLVLWFAGSEVERIYGSREFLAMYLVAGIISNLSWAFADLLGPDQIPNVALGASGAVSATLVIMAMHYPNRIILLMFIIPVPLWLCVILFLVKDLVGFSNQMNNLETEPIAYMAHLSGAAYGFLYHYSKFRWTTLFAQLGRSLGRSRPRLRVVRSDDTRPASVEPGQRTPRQRERSDQSDQLERRVDELLDKIARDGRESLTADENQVLEEASRRARNRRRGDPRVR